MESNSNVVPPWDFKRLENLARNTCEEQVTNWTDLMQLQSSIEDGTHTLTPEVLSALFVHINTCLDAILESLETTMDLRKMLKIARENLVATTG